MRPEARSQFSQHGPRKEKTVETSELKVLGRNRGKSSQSRSCHQHQAAKKKRNKSLKHAGSKVINENETQPETARKVKEPIIKIYSEDSGRAATDYADDNYGKFLGRNSGKMESQLSQETQVTELRMESLHSQDDLLDHNNNSVSGLPFSQLFDPQHLCSSFKKANLYFVYCLNFIADCMAYHIQQMRWKNYEKEQLCNST